MVAFGQSLGAVVGAMYVETQVGSLSVGALLLVAAGLLAFQLQVTNYIDRREHREENISADILESKEHGNKSAERPWKVPVINGTGPFKLVLENRYLLMIGLMMLLLNLINSTGGYIIGSSFETAAAAATGQTEGVIYTEYLTRLSASFFRAVNISALIIQFLLVSRIIQFLGVGIGLMILPAIAIGGYGLIALFPILPVIRMVKIAENSTDYSLQNTVRNILFLPTTREQKYKGKQVVDSFFVRVGDAMQAVVVFVGTSVLAASLASFAAFNAIIAIAWMILAFMIGKKYRQRTATNDPTG
ncbi:MAG: Npt1/Npt2 family nucleotide transporter [Acidobacteriota bacterium]|nr:Npt1/Npt2 family nucleotide transporter [Acidobacteriota bacterium]